MDLYQILTVCGVSGIISGIVGVLIAVFLKRPLEKRVAENERRSAEAKAQSEAIERQNKATMLGVQALLRDRLLQAFAHYHEQGFVTYNERQNVKNMYTQYEALGPNSVMDDMYQKFVDLPDQEPAA